MKIKIDSKAFVRWYYSDKDARRLLNSVRDSLIKTKSFEVRISSIFYECDRIPSKLRIDYDFDKHSGKSLDPAKCVLV